MLKFSVLLIALFVSSTTLAAGGGHASDDNTPPSKRYSGSAPIDLGRGLPFNNGTYGTQNPEYEAKANAGYTAPGLRASAYSYKERKEFVRNIKGLFPIYEDAIANLKSNRDERAEVKAYREQQTKDLETRLEAAREAADKANGANENEWDAAQENARKAFADLQALLVRNNTKY